MSTNTLARAFLRVAIFQGLHPLQLSEIARRSDRIIFQPGDTIIEKDHPGETAYLIVSGQAVRVLNQNDVEPAEVIPEGSIVAEMMMLIDSAHTSTVVAQTQVRALGIDRVTLHKMMLEDRSIAEHFVAKITSRLSQLAIALRQIDKTIDSNQTTNNHQRSADQVTMPEIESTAKSVAKPDDYLSTAVH